jgi:hypothetical protein
MIGSRGGIILKKHIKLYKMQILYNLGNGKRRDFADLGAFVPIFAHISILNKKFAKSYCTMQIFLL